MPKEPCFGSARDDGAHRELQVRGRRPHTPRGGVRSGHSLPPPPRRRPSHGQRGRRGLRVPFRGAPRGPREGGHLRLDVPGSRAGHRLLRHDTARRVPRPRRSVLRVLHRQRRRVRALPALAGAPRGGRRRVRGDGGHGGRAWPAARATINPPDGDDGQDEAELHLVRVPRQAFHGSPGRDRQHGLRARAERSRRHSRRPVHARNPCADGLSNRPRGLLQPASGAAARVRAVARRAASGVRRAPLFRQRRVLHRDAGARDSPRAGAQRAPLPVGAAWPAGSRRAAPLGRGPRRAAPGGVPGGDEGEGHGVADEGAAGGYTRPRRRGGLRDARRLELGPGEPVVRRAYGAVAALRRTAPQCLHSGRLHGRGSGHGGGQEEQQFRARVGAGTSCEDAHGRRLRRREEGEGEVHGNEG